MYWLFLLILLYALCSDKEAGDLPKFLPIGRFKTILILLIYINSCLSFVILYKQALKFQPRALFVNYMQSLVKKHKNEKDFSFYAGSDVFGNDVIPWLKKQGDPEGKQYTLAELLFPNYYKTQNAKYLIQAGSFLPDSKVPKP